MALGLALWGAGLTSGCDSQGGSTAEVAETAAPAESPHSPGEGPGVGAADPPGARRSLLESLRADRDAPRHPSDGGGRAWLVDPEPAVAGRYGRWTIEYEAGPLGVATGGAVFLQIPPFWRWSPAWVDPEGLAPEEVRRAKPGFTEVTCTVSGVDLEVKATGDGLVMASLRSGALAPGDRVRFAYGANPNGSKADDFAERQSAFIVSVDGDGDGVRRLLAELPALDVAPGPAAQLVAHVPSILAPGEVGRLTLAVLDAQGSHGVTWEGRLRLSGLPAEAGLPGEVTLTADFGGVLHVPVSCPTEGTYRLRVEAEVEAGAESPGLFALSNPLVVQADAEPILWGDLHGHSQLSDGTGTPHDYFAYARDVAALDVAALTDHDHWGFLPLAEHPELWAAISDQVQAFHDPPRFITLLGYEWTSWIYGHRHVLSFEEQPLLSVLDSVEDRYETPRQLWDALRGQAVLTFAHHSAGGPVPTDWSVPLDPEFEPVTEVVSVHGSSEAADSPMLIYRPRAGNFVRDVLGRGVRLGFVGSGDGHDGHPGLAHLSNPTGSGGLAAVLTADRSRAGVLAALRQRRCYATSGPRMIVRATLGGARMGSGVPASREPQELVLLVRGTAPVEFVDLIRNQQVVERLPVSGQAFDLLTTFRLEALEAGEFVYLRVIQSDGHAAWTSPFFVESP